MTYYYLYQITNLVNAKIYVGVHKTKSIDDGYMGSGKIIQYAIAKHGIDNFKKDILEFFDTSEAMYAREKEVVTREFLLREDTYNLRRGGFGGFDYIQTMPKYKEWTKQGGISVNNPACPIKLTQRKEQVENFNKLGAAAYLKKLEDNTGKIWWKPNKSFLGKHHSNETKQKMSEIAKLRLVDKTKNSQFGTMWITNGATNKKVKNDINIPDGWYRGRKL